MLKLNTDIKLIPIFFLKGLIFSTIIYVLPEQEYGLFSFLIALSYGIARLLDFGTSEGIIARNIEEEHLNNLFKITGIKIIITIFVPAVLVTIDLIFKIGIPTVYLFLGCYLIIFIREYLVSVFLSIAEKNIGDINIRPNYMISNCALQIVGFVIIYFFIGHLSIEQFVAINLISSIIALIYFFGNEIPKCFSFKISLENFLNLFKSNFRQHKTQIKISWVSVLNKLLEVNILFFLAGVEQFALFSVYTSLVAACFFLVKYLRVRSVSLVKLYKKELIDHKFLIFTSIIICTIICWIIYILLMGPASKLNGLWFLKFFLLLPFLVLPIGVTLFIDWVYTIILRQSVNQHLEVNKVLLGIGISYVSTILVGVLVWLGFEDFNLLLIIAVKDVVIFLVVILYSMSKVKSFE